MQISINYGDKQLTLELPKNVSLDEYEYMNREVPFDFSALNSALKDEETGLFPLSSADLYVVNDAYRHTPTGQILTWLDDNGHINDRALFIVAAGCHQAPTETQLRKIFGRQYDIFKSRIVVHDARDRGRMVKQGEDASGYPVYINRHLFEARHIVVIGSVEPHYFAGFTGGRKSIFPGLCDYDTTVRNHARAVSFEAAPMCLEGNPVAEDLEALMQLVADKLIFSIQVVAVPGGEIAGIFCGNIKDSFGKAALLAENIFGVRSDHNYDLILGEVRPPLDSNLYQLQKSLENCQTALKDGGTIILFSPCYEGIGSESFYKLADSWNSEPDCGRANLDRFGVHKLHRVEQIAERTHVYLHSDLPDGVSDKVFFKSVREPQALLNNIVKEGMIIKAALIRDAGQTVLTVRQKVGFNKQNVEEK